MIDGYFYLSYEDRVSRETDYQSPFSFSTTLGDETIDQSDLEFCCVIVDNDIFKTSRKTIFINMLAYFILSTVYFVTNLLPVSFSGI